MGRPLCDGATMYTTVYPCLNCSKLIVECNVKTVIYDKEYNSMLSEELLSKAGIQLVKFNRPYEKFI